MKIAHIVATLPPDIGGMGQVAFDEARGLAARGHEVTVFTIASPYHKYQDEKLPFKVVRKKIFLKTSSAGFWPGIRDELSSFDMVHLHFPFYGAAEWVLWSGIPYVVTYHMDAKPNKRYQKVIKYLYDNLFSERILTGAKRVILVDRHVPLEFKEKLNRDRILILPNAVDTKIFRSQDSSLAEFTLDKLQGKRILLFVGNLLPIKGLAVLLSAIKKVGDKNLHLLVVGGGYNEKEYRRQAEKLGITDQVTWLGPYFDKSKLAKIYNLPEAVVVPSFSESFSLVAAEALAVGKPVIASNIPGIRDRVREGETGYLFEAGSSRALSESIKKFLSLSAEGRQRLGRIGMELVTRDFSLDKHVQRLEEIYKIIKLSS